MASHTHFVPKKFAAGVRWNVQELGGAGGHGAPAEPVAARVRRGLGAALERSSQMVIWGVAIAVAVGAATAMIQSVIAPRYIVTVQQFEITPEAAKRLGVTGKGAADLVIDRLNRTATDASRFHGADYYAYDHHGTQPIALDEGIRVPVQSSYDIEVHGVSVDTIVKAYRHLRYKEWLVSGDVMAAGDGYVVRIRLNRDDDAQSWQAASSGPSEVMERIQSVTDAMLAEESPELFGSAFLKQGRYAEAAGIFQQWAVREPANWRPYYYMSLAYDSEEREQEAANLAQWSKNVAEHGRRTKAMKAPAGSAADSGSAASLAEVTQAVWDTRDDTGGRELTATEKATQLRQMRAAEQRLTALGAGKGASLTFALQLAKVLAKEAGVEASMSGRPSQEAYDTQARAVALLTEVVPKMPANGGLHEQRAVLLQGLVAMEKAMGKDRGVIAEHEAEEIGEFTRALELRPTQVSPLWGAVYSLLDLGRDEEAIRLARTMTLLQPDSTAAKTAYVVALEHGTATPERRAEITERLGPLLGVASRSELDTLGNSFRDHGDGERVAEVAASVGRRFPGDGGVKAAVGGAAAAGATQVGVMGRRSPGAEGGS